MNELGEMNVNALSLPWKKNVMFQPKDLAKRAPGLTGEWRIGVGAS